MRVFPRESAMTVRNSAAVVVALVFLGCAAAGTPAFAQVRQVGAVTVFTPPTQANQAAIDFANAQPMPLPEASSAPPSPAEALRNAVNPFLLFGPAGISRGGIGTGQKAPIRLLPAQSNRAGTAPPQAIPYEFGTAGQPYTTSRVNASYDNTVNYYPYRAAGKLFFLEGSAVYVCSASLIKPGVVVTAAHCVANYGQQQFYSNWVFVPAYNNGQAPYGIWHTVNATVMTTYYDGTDNCYQYGVICPDDMAVLLMTQNSGYYPGQLTGWFGYGWNGYSYNSSGQALITQLGYPVALDGGRLMERNDSQGFEDATLSSNTVIGSLMTGGSSGGPWLVNLGQAPSLSGTSFGTYAAHNIVVGVTSWGYTDLTVKQQGAAPFTSNNITVLLSTVCTATPAAC